MILLKLTIFLNFLFYNNNFFFQGQESFISEICDEISNHCLTLPQLPNFFNNKKLSCRMGKVGVFSNVTIAEDCFKFPDLERYNEKLAINGYVECSSSLNNIYQLPEYSLSNENGDKRIQINLKTNSALFYNTTSTIIHMSDTKFDESSDIRRLGIMFRTHKYLSCKDHGRQFIKKDYFKEIQSFPFSNKEVKRQNTKFYKVKKKINQSKKISKQIMLLDNQCTETLGNINDFTRPSNIKESGFEFSNIAASYK